MSMQDPATGEVRLSIASRFENIELVQAVLEDSLKRLDLEDDARYWIGIAVREAVANAIKHGNRQKASKKVYVDLAVDDEELIIRVEDQGEGFDLTSVPDPLDPANLLKPNGRGIFYMNKFMDTIDYSFADSGGTVVTLKKRLGGESEIPSTAES